MKTYHVTIPVTVTVTVEDDVDPVSYVMEEVNLYEEGEIDYFSDKVEIEEEIA